MKIINDKRFFGMLGFAMRAGKLTVGADLVCKELPSGRVSLVIVSLGASEATRKRLKYKCEYYSVPRIEVDAEPTVLAERLGKSSSTVAIAVKDDGFAKEIAMTVE